MNKRMVFIFFSIFITVPILALQPQGVRLWEKDAPLAQGDSLEDIPMIFPFVLDSVSPAVLICPGGGYIHRAEEKEGFAIAKYFNSIGYSAFVLQYRISSKEGVQYHYPTQLMDVSRAMKLIKHNCENWKIDTSKLGVMGFSAGGHLASTLGTHWHQNYFPALDMIDSISAKPTFMILIYPVITLSKDEYTHKGSMRNFIGNDTTLKIKFSNELQVSSFTPPTFIIQADDDIVVPAENSVLFYLALRKNKIPAEMHIFNYGKHGFGLAKDKEGLSEWSNLMKNWLKTIK